MNILTDIGIIKDSNTVNLDNVIKNWEIWKLPTIIALKVPTQNIIKNKATENWFIFLSIWVDFMLLFEAEFFSSLVLVPTAMTTPIISLFLIVHPDQTVFSKKIGSSTMFPS